MEKYFLSMAIFENSLLTEYVFVEWWFDDYDYHAFLPRWYKEYKNIFYYFDYDYDDNG